MVINQQIVLLTGLAGLAIFLIAYAIASPQKRNNQIDVQRTLKQYRSRSLGNNKALDGVQAAGMRRALAKDGANEKYLRWLKQANWFWEVGEPEPPVAKAPFWNLETLWSEKFIGALVWGVGSFALISIVGMVLSTFGTGSMLTFLIAGGLIGAVLGYVGFINPDSQVGSAASTRQKELSLEMGFRVPELRADVMAGATIQRAIRGMARRPGGPFVEELRRAVTVLDVSRDEAQAMDYLLDRNRSNELMTEFANSVKMVSRQGGQIGPVLNVIADLAQERLRLSITSQARKNLQEMTRPIALASMIVTTLLVIVPALSGMSASFGQ
jgi:Flp pilus assembly protein TadB